MKRTACLLLAISSIFGCVMLAGAAERPRYGGTLRVVLRTQPDTLDPAMASVWADSRGASRLVPLLYHTLTRLDETGTAKPSLATAWKQETDRRWRVTIRPNVQFSDGTPLTANLVAKSLRASNKEWSVSEAGDAVIIETERKNPALPTELALQRNAIALRSGPGIPIGTGPFVVTDFQPQLRLVLSANPLCWEGAPFVERVEVTLGRNLRDQMVDLELGRADVIEIGPETGARIPSSARVYWSQPVELVALRFSDTLVGEDLLPLRQAFALSLDRDSIVSVLLRKQAEPAGNLLPNWISGYGFLFSTARDLASARQLRGTATQVRPLTVEYESGDALARVIAERVAVNAGDAGLSVRAVSRAQTAGGDVVVVRTLLPAIDSGVALNELASSDMLSLDEIATATAEQEFEGMQRQVNRSTVVPLAYMRTGHAVASRVRDWTASADGMWNVGNAWVDNTTMSPRQGQQ